MIVQSMWIGDRLSRMENACIRSWLDNGYQYNLFVYDRVMNLPDGVTIRDANEIVEDKRIFKYNLPNAEGGGSFSGFSNLFRYRLLMDGGVWVDTDMLCRNRLPDLDILLVEEGDLIASCIMKIPRDMAEYCYNACMLKDNSSLRWGETGPKLVTEAVNVHGLNKLVQDRMKYFPIMYWEIDRFLDDGTVDNDIYTVHFWNEIWRRRGIDKNVTYGRNTYYEKLISS